MVDGSVLALFPHREDVDLNRLRDRLNREVKHRQLFRPYGPVVREEDADATPGKPDEGRAHGSTTAPTPWPSTGPRTRAGPR